LVLAQQHVIRCVLTSETTSMDRFVESRYVGKTTVEQVCTGRVNREGGLCEE
jgi:hypothetical protein